MFKEKDVHNTTWTHPRSRDGNMIDFIITRCWEKMDICSTRTMRGSNCGTDNQNLRSRVIFSIRKMTQSERSYATRQASLGNHDNKHQESFDPNDQMLRDLMAKRDQSHQRVLQIRSTRSTIPSSQRCMQNATEIHTILKA